MIDFWSPYLSEAVGPIVRHAGKIIKGFSENENLELKEAIDNAFNQWKLDYGQPPVGGLLGNSGLLSWIQVQPEPDMELEFEPGLPLFDETPAHLCAGISVKNPIDLGYKLWFEDDELFKELLDIAGLDWIFAHLIVSTEPTPLNLSSIIQAYGMIRDVEIHKQRIISELRRHKLDAYAKKQKEGNEKANAKFRESKEYCVREAADVWESELASEGEISRIGNMAEWLYRMLDEQGLWVPKDPQKVKKWLKSAEREGMLTIPDEAKKPGRPPRN